MSLVSFGVSGIYLSFLMTVIGSMVARSRGWVAEGQFRLGRWAWPVSIAGALYLGLMLINVVAPTGVTSPRAYFNLDWITLLVIFVITVVGALYFFIARPDRGWATTSMTRSRRRCRTYRRARRDGQVAQARGFPLQRWCGHDLDRTNAGVSPPTGDLGDP